MELRASDDVVRCRIRVSELAASIGLSKLHQTKITTAASELARNVIVHGHGGKMRWEVVDGALKIGVRLVFEDQGPGIPELDLALRDGWSSKRSLGLGLPGSRRLVDEFDLWTSVGVGTRVTVTMWRA